MTLCLFHHTMKYKKMKYSCVQIWVQVDYSLVKMCILEAYCVLCFHITHAKNQINICRNIFWLCQGNIENWEVPSLTEKKNIFFLIYCFQKGLLNIMICGNQPVCMCRLVGVDLYNLNWNISCFQVITLLYSIDIHYVINDSICGWYTEDTDLHALLSVCEWSVWVWLEGDLLRTWAAGF